MSTWVTGTTVVENSVDTENLTSNVTITLIVGWNGGSWASDNPYYYINVNGSRVKSGNANFNTGQATSGSQTIATWTGNVPHESDGTGSMTWAVGYEGIYAGEGIYSTASGTKTLTPIEIPDPDPPTPTGDGNYLDKTGLAYFWSKLKSFFVAKETGKGLSTNDFTTAEKTKLSGIETGAEVNVIESIALNGTDQTVTNKAVDLELVTSVNGQTGDVIVEGGEGGGTSNNMVMLWSNPNTSVAFANQTITLSESVDNFDCILVDCAFGVESNLGHHSNICVPSASSHWALFAGKTTPYVSGRSVDFSGTSATFGQGWLMDNNWQSNNNGYCIPLKVYGINIKGVGKSGQLELAWSNPSPTASFASQTITLKDNYPVVFVVSTYSASDDITSKNGTVSTIISGYRGQVIAWNENMTWTYGRSCVLNGSSLDVGDARWLIQNSSASAIHNDACVPMFVFGLKTVAPKVGKTLLWTNPSPTDSFASQTITLGNDASNYDCCIVTARYGNWQDSYVSTIVFPNGVKQSITASQENNGATVVHRDCTINGLSCTFGNGWYVAGSSIGNGASYCIPTEIYGINFSGTPSNNGFNIDSVYPVGSIYMSVNNSNPSLLFGGTWERIQDTFLLASGSTYTAGSTGGEATHTLDTTELPSHNHYSLANQSLVIGRTNTGSSNKCDIPTSYTGSKTVYIQSNTTSNTGGGQAHNNMPPYLAVYVWKRTA